MIRVFIEDINTRENVEYICDDFIFACSNKLQGNVDVSKTDNVAENCFLVEKIRKEISDEL